MRIATVCILFSFIVHFCPVNTVSASAQPETELLPDITLTVPDNPEHRQYLGLKGEPGTQFKADEIEADILMIELFSMYCPYCQSAAPSVNELYDKMEQTKTKDLKLVIIGIGANNTDLEVDTFRQGFDIPFPLFSDPDMAIYKSLGGKGTPGFIGCKKNSNNKSIIFYRKSGAFPDATVFLENLLKQSGLK